MLSKLNKQFLIILSGPSGAGKSTLVKHILSIYGSKMGTTISYTTRPRRGKETNGREYYFITKEEFIRLKQKNTFAEWAFVYGNYYGTDNNQITQHWNEGRVIIKDFDLQGAVSIKKLYPQSLSIFIIPPSIEEVKKRMQKRQENPSEDMQIRLQQAPNEITKSVEYDYRLKNIDIKKSTQQLKKIIENYIK